MEKFDIYIVSETIKKPLIHILNDYNLQDSWWNKRGFIGLSLDLENAKEIKKQLTQRGMVLTISPILYRESKKVSYNQAKNTALNELNRLKNINSKYGELKNGLDSPIWYAFLADDYELQKEGYTSGYWGCYIDKISGVEVGKDIIMKYEFL